MNKSISQLAQQLALTATKDYAYGRYHDCLLTIATQPKRLVVTINAIDQDNQMATLLSVLNNTEQYNRYGLLGYHYNLYSITLEFDLKATPQQVKQLLDQYLPQWQPLLITNGYCSLCQQPSTALNTVYYQQQVIQISDECLPAIMPQTNQDNHYFLGSVAALLGALICAIPWAIAYYLGWFVGWLGFLISIGAKKGYEMVGGKSGKVKLIIVAVATILGVIIGNFMADIYYIVTMINNGEILARYLDIPYLIVMTLGSSPEYLSATLSNIGMGLIFGGLGMWSTISQLTVENKVHHQPVILKQ